MIFKVMHNNRINLIKVQYLIDLIELIELISTYKAEFE